MTDNILNVLKENTEMKRKITSYEEVIKDLNEKLNDRETTIKKQKTEWAKYEAKIGALECRIHLYEKSTQLDYAKILSLLNTVNYYKKEHERKIDIETIKLFC